MTGAGTDGEDLPPVTCRLVVPPAWIDENDHVDTVEYKRIVDHGTSALFAAAGLTRPALAAHGGTIFQAEMHIRYERELRLGDEIAVRSWVIAADQRRIHHFHEIFQEARGFRAATVELMSLYVDVATRKVAPMPAGPAAALHAMAIAHGAARQPAGVSSRIGFTRN